MTKCPSDGDTPTAEQFDFKSWTPKSGINEDGVYVLDCLELPQWAALDKPDFRYYVARGGRGSGKSHKFAEKMCIRAAMQPGFRGVCIREVQKSLRDSAKLLIEDKIKLHNMASIGFEIQADQVRTPGGGMIIFVGMNNTTAESIKSLEGFDVAWVEEAQTLSERSLTLLRPTIRKAGSQIWFSYNPTRKSDPVDSLFTGDDSPTNSVVRTVNWDANPFFPEVMEQERRDDLRMRPEQYDHIWEGAYATYSPGAYFTAHLLEASQQGRIGRVAADPLMTYRLFFDIGGAGNRSDATSIWVCQFIGSEVRVLNYYEAQGQPLGFHLEWLRRNGYGPEHAAIWLPHDGKTSDRLTHTTFESALREVGYAVTVIPNQGRGAAIRRIETVRRHFAKCWFNDDTTLAGREALGAYHEKIDPVRDVGLGPEHNWASHAADAFGLMAECYEPPSSTADFNKEITYEPMALA